MTLTVGGVKYEVPGYHSIADPYEREEYFNKFTWSIKNGVSMAEVKKKVEARELDFSLSEKMRRYVDRIEGQRERAQWLSDQFPKPLPPDRPPVKVRFLPDEGEDALPGWMQKLERNPRLESGEAVASGSDSGVDLVSEGDSPIDTEGTLSPKDLPDMVKPTPSDQSMAELEKQLTPEGIETKLSNGLSPERFSKVQQLIDQYGTEEGLRRLREMDPEAAKQFERERSAPPVRSKPDDDAPATQKRQIFFNTLNDILPFNPVCGVGGIPFFYLLSRPRTFSLLPSIRIFQKRARRFP